MTRGVRPAGLRCWLLAALLSACQPGPPDERTRFEHWLAKGKAQEIEHYRRFLHERGVGDAVALHELLRSGRRWRACGVDEFSLAPPGTWDAMVPTLQLVAALRDAGLLDDARVASGYRTPAFNTCEGGSTRSRHVAHAALDFDLSADPDIVERLCGFWRTTGTAHRFGLGFYSQPRSTSTAAATGRGATITRAGHPCAAVSRTAC